jgi:hypothetical protein
MTRINCVPVKELTDKHLLAEYRELPRIFRLARDPKSYEKFPQAYTLGAGHVKFFYDKLGYCEKRQGELFQELIRRGFKPNFDPSNIKNDWFKEKHLWNDWEPTAEALEINRQRIKERLS